MACLLRKSYGSVGVAQSDVEAVRWYKKIVGQGNMGWLHTKKIRGHSAIWSTCVGRAMIWHGVIWKQHSGTERPFIKGTAAAS